MTKQEYKQAANYWVEREDNFVKMPRKELLEDIEVYIKANDTCALATACNEFTRCTPIEYVYIDGAFYIFTEGGKKFKALEENKKVGIAIFDKFSGFSSLKGLQVEGVASMIELDSDEYKNIAKEKGLKLENLKRINHVLYLIKVEVKLFEYINSDFKKKGYSVRQKCSFE